MHAALPWLSCFCLLTVVDVMMLLCVLVVAVPMSNWGRVYYTNLLSGIALLLVFPMCKSEHQMLRTYTFSHAQVSLLVLSCMIGVCMSHAGEVLLCRTLKSVH